MCEKLIGSGNNGITGGYTNPYQCAKGLVSQECGGEQGQMINKFSVAKLVEMIEKEESTPNGNLENILDFILELEKSGEYPTDNTCELKSAYYRWIGNDKSALYWAKQAVNFSPNNIFHLSDCYRILMKLGEFKKALPIIDKSLT